MAYLGGVFTTDIAFAALMGAAGIAFSAAVFGFLFFRYNSEERSGVLPWLLIQSYAAGNAVMIAIGRSGFGRMELAMSSRYASLPALFWISLIVTATFVLRRIGTGKRFSTFTPVLLATMIGSLVVSMYQVGTRRAQELLHKASFQPLATYQFNSGFLIGRQLSCQ